MLIGAFFVLLAYACFRGLTRDVGVVALVVLVGFAQDPARKLLAGEPIMMTIMVGIVVGCMAARQLFVNNRAVTDPFSKWTDSIMPALGLYLTLIGIQAVHSLLRYGSPLLTGLGAIFYIAPLIAIVVAYSQFQRFEVVRHFLLVFCLLALIASASVIYSYIGGESRLLGEVGSGLIIYDQGTILKAYSGLMRSSEIASWHMGACVCFLVILIVDRGSTSALVITSLSIGLLMAAIILTGRRKMILQIVIFSSIYFPLLRYYQGRLSNRFLSVVIIGSAVLSVVYLWFLPLFQGSDYDLYLARGVSVFADAGERFSTLGLGSIYWAYDQHGFFGGGLGIASQGSQHFVEGNVGGAGEGGIGKLVSELGLGALIVLSWLGIAFYKHIHNCLGLVASSVPDKLPFAVGILVFLLANVPTFIVASQVYGDVFVLIILGFLAGSLFALPSQVVSRLQGNHPQRVN
jgi:hypothetical protein